MPVSYAEIKHEFDVTLGYIHDDIQALCAGTKTLNYTVALLIGVACEALEDAGFYASKKVAMAELLPDSDWKQLSGVLFEALRNGLAHNFDTKHIYIDRKVVQIYFVWDLPRIITIDQRNGTEALTLGTRKLGAAMCEKINEFRAQLKRDPLACDRFNSSLTRSRRRVDCSPSLWSLLRSKS